MTPSGQPCTDRACITAHEGEVIEIAGTFIQPDPTRISTYRVVLSDGSKVNVDRGDGDVSDAFRPESDGKRVVVRGRIFTGAIPERYEIIARDGTPWLLEISVLTFVDD